MIVVPTPAAADYLRAVGAAAIYVIADPWGSSRIGTSQHLQRTFDAWEQEHFEPKWVGWVGSLKTAEWLAGTLDPFKRKHGTITALSWEEIVKTIEDAAGIPNRSATEYVPLYIITEHQTAIKNAAEMAQKVRVSMDVLKQNGALRVFNEAYKQYNQECKARRERAINFGVFEAELSNSVANILAKGAEPLSETILVSMRQKFPFLSSATIKS